MKAARSFRVLIAVMLATAFLGGCSTSYFGSSITYTFEPRFNFSQVKTYGWADSKPYGVDSLLESNVRFHADKALGAKGFTVNQDKPDLRVLIRYEYEYREGLRVLTLNISRADNNEPVWRGMATGQIKTDAASADLKAAIDGMLVNFPPR